MSVLTFTVPEPVDLDKLDLPGLEALSYKLSEFRDQVKTAAGAVQQRIGDLETTGDAQRRLSTLTGDQKRALARQLSAQGIGSTEKLGTPGA